MSRTKSDVLQKKAIHKSLSHLSIFFSASNFTSFFNCYVQFSQLFCFEVTVFHNKTIEKSTSKVTSRPYYMAESVWDIAYLSRKNLLFCYQILFQRYLSQNLISLQKKFEIGQKVITNGLDLSRVLIMAWIYPLNKLLQL